MMSMYTPCCRAFLHVQGPSRNDNPAIAALQFVAVSPPALTTRLSMRLMLSGNVIKGTSLGLTRSGPGLRYRQISVLPQFCSRTAWRTRAQQAEDGSGNTGTATTITATPDTNRNLNETSTRKASPASVVGSSSGLFSTPQQQSAGFLALTAASLAFGIAALAAPELLLSAAVDGDHGVLDVAFTRVAGATMFISAAAEYSLQDAVNAGHLKSATYQRLLLAIVAKDVLYIAAFALSPGLWNPLLFAIYPGSAGASLLITAATLQSAFKQSGAASVGEGVKAAVGGLSLPKSSAGWVYDVFILLYLATVAACYAPEVIFTGEPLTATAELLKHTWSPGFLLAAASCWVLGDAADRERLAASTFRRLNLGLAGVEAGYSAVFAWSVMTGLAVNDSSSWSNLAGSVGITLYFLYQYTSNAKSQS